MKTFRLKCEILSPLHIGTGDTLDPLSYVVKDGYLYAFSFNKLVLAMDDTTRAEFDALIDKGDLIAIRSFVSRTARLEGLSHYRVEVTRRIQSLYSARINDIQNQLLVSPFVRAKGEAAPLVPGSSIKGAIRTAVVSGLAKKSKLAMPKGYKEEVQFEREILGYRDGKDDPFRMIRLRDKVLPSDTTIVREITNSSKKQGGWLQSNNVQMICEVTHAAITGKAVEFETEISFDDDLQSAGLFKRLLTDREVVDFCTDFYRPKMLDEHKKFYTKSLVEKCSSQLMDTSLDGSSFLLRVGRFSGAECVTLNKYRNPRPPGNKVAWGTTRNLAEGVYPMGWVKATLCS